ncbi:MAG TPA: hypothetical protein VGX96_12585 [Candidatus Elarobacter sp.]|jgi:hypothetical protein|nr:hypothetical protein [Candidatus Elarobacter sp.]
MTPRAPAGFAALVLAVSGCAGGARSVPAAHRAPAAARVSVGFTMHWPARTTRSHRHAAFVSPSTASVVVEVNPDAATPGPVTFANAPAGGGTSSIAIDAPPGDDVFLIALYDAPQTAGETTAAGNELGRVRVAQTIVPNATNTLSATVIGTVASVRIGPLPNQPNVIAQPASGPAGWELVGRAPATFAVAPLDAGGNAIVQPDAPVTISLAPNVRATGILSVTPVAGTTDQFTVQAVAPNGTTYPTSLAATARDANGNLASSSAVVDATSAVYVAYANGGAPAVARFDAHGNGVPLPAGAFAGLGNPVAMAYDPDDREILVADAALGKVLAFDENGAPLAAFTAPAIAGVNALAYDPHNANVYAAGSGGVTVFAPNGGPPNNGAPATFAAASATGIAFVAAAPFGPLNRIAVGNAAASKVAFFNENGNAAGSFSVSAAPAAIAYAPPVGPNASPQTTAQVYVVSASGIAAFGPFGTRVSAAADGGGPFGIVVDPNSGTPQIAERSGNAIAAYLDDLSATDATRSFATPGALGFTQPQGVCDVF